MVSDHQATVHTDTEDFDSCIDAEPANVRPGVSLNNAQQSVIAQTVKNAQGVNFVSSGKIGGSNGLTQSISAHNVEIQGDVKYDATNYFHGSEDIIIRSWVLSFPNLDFERKQERNFEISRKAPGTGEWLLRSKEFLDWRDGRHSVGRKLWCHGIPGAGKTILASIVINRLITQSWDHKGMACIYVYFDYKDQKKQNLIAILSSLLVQLVRKTDTLAEEVKSMYRQLKHAGTRPNSTQYLSMLECQTKLFDRVFIVTDALDECLNSIGTNTLDEFLKAIHRLPANVYLLFTSRPDISIQQKVKPSLELKILAKNDDIRIYFDSQIKSIEHLKRLVDKGEQNHKYFRDDVLSAVVENSKGMFLLAQLHLEYLASKHGLQDFESGVKSLPHTPNGVYETALIRIKEQDQFKQDLAINTLAWLVFAERALSTTELRHALAIQGPNKNLLDDGFEAKDLTSACAGIVLVDQGNDAICLAHHTAETYLRENESRIFEDAQSKIAEACLSYLICAEFIQDHPSTKEGKNAYEKYPFLVYAANFWGKHIAAGTGGRGPVLKLAWKFLSDAQRLKNVIQVMVDFQTRNEGDVSGLHIAAYFGLDKLIRKAKEMKKHISLNARTQRGETAMHWAAFFCQREFLKLLIEIGADRNIQDNQGRTALHNAVINGDKQSVSLLLLGDGQINLELEDVELWTVLRWAAANGNAKISKLLLESGAKIDAADKNGWTALRWAAQKGHKRVVELLIRYCARLDGSSGDDDWTLLRWAASEGDVAIIQLLIEKKVLLDSVDRYGWTPLRWAIEYNHGEVVWLLIKANVDVNIPDNKGDTPLHSAIKRWKETSDKSLVWLLLESKAKINAQTESNKTALHIASSLGQSSIVWLLLEKGADIHAQTKPGFTALHIASSLGHGSIVRLLLQKDADMHSSTKLRLTALHLASSEGRSTVVMQLLENGADPYRKDNNARTALHCAIAAGHKKVAQLLIQNSKNLIHAVDDVEQTVLHIAASIGDDAIVTLLLDNGAEMDVSDREGYTPLHRAVSKHYENVVFLLLERGADVNISKKKRLTVLESAIRAGNMAIIDAIRSRTHS